MIVKLRLNFCGIKNHVRRSHIYGRFYGSLNNCVLCTSKVCP